ncbi:MAG: starvation/stationary phase protection protein [Candidatus Saccharibacteria bacterium]|nr:starvation/stationary phase protection protein [Candidatus Saccharibacteria bacterium]
MATADNASKTYLALSDEALQESTMLLQTILANTVFFYSLYKKYHWHVTGEDFYQYHLLFDKHADEQPAIIDLVAERLRTLGSMAPAMPADVAANTTIKEASDAGHDAQAMVKNLLKAHEDYIEVVRKAIEKTEKNNDMGTNDILVSDVLRVHELELWFIRSSLA